jgi:hypothetical protein
MTKGPRRIGGQNLEGRYFIITVPEGWTENDPMPAPSPNDAWFDRLTDFKEALDCPWIRRPLRYKAWSEVKRPPLSASYAARIQPVDRASGE